MLYLVTYVCKSAMGQALGDAYVRMDGVTVEELDNFRKTLKRRIAAEGFAVERDARIVYTGIFPMQEDEPEVPQE